MPIPIGASLISSSVEQHLYDKEEGRDCKTRVLNKLSPFFLPSLPPPGRVLTNWMERKNTRIKSKNIDGLRHSVI